MTTTTTSSPPTAARPTPTGCCPPFDPATWDDREIVWHERPFLKEHLRALFHIPLGMDRAMTRVHDQIAAAHAEPAQNLMLADDTSPWGTDLYIDVTRPVPGAQMASLSGTFLTKVYDGPFRDAPRWMADMKRHVAARGRTLEKLYLSYTTCPSCAKAYGHNYVVVFAKVAERAPAG